MLTQIKELIGCGLIKDWKTRYSSNLIHIQRLVVVWLKIGKHDIQHQAVTKGLSVVVWLKIGKHDIILDCLILHS